MTDMLLLGLHAIYSLLDFRYPAPNSNPVSGSLLHQLSGRRVTYLFHANPITKKPSLWKVDVGVLDKRL